MLRPGVDGRDQLIIELRVSLKFDYCRSQLLFLGLVLKEKKYDVPLRRWVGKAEIDVMRSGGECRKMGVKEKMIFNFARCLIRMLFFRLSGSAHHNMCVSILYRYVLWSIPISNSCAFQRQTLMKLPHYEVMKS